MSETENVNDISEYRRTSHEVEEKMADVASDEHALKKEFGDDEDAKKMQYDPRDSGQRFVDFYQDRAAALREALSNGETACIDAAEHMLIEDGYPEDEIPEDIFELFEVAQERVDYEPLIEIVYNESEDGPRLIINDNGIGISPRRYNVLRNVGYSTSHMEGNRGDGFGIGYLSLFQLVGTNGSFRMYTRSRETDDSYSTANFLANFEYLDAKPENYGTRFEFPEFSERAKGIDVHSKVEEFSQGMRVPVLYRHFDEDGQETQFSDDYLPHNMEDEYPDDAVLITVEDEYFKAICSPESPDGRGYVTYNVSFPIQRNEPGFGTNSRLNAPWKWDFRSKREDGPVVRGPNEGLIPISKNNYDKLDDEEEKERHVPRTELTDDDIVMPAPTSNRDAFEDGYDEFWRYVSNLLHEEWERKAKEILEDVDSFDDFMSRDEQEQNTIFRAYREFGAGKSADADAIEGRIDNTLGADVDGEAFARISHLSKKVNVLSRTASRALKSNCHGLEIKKILQRDGDVFIGQTLSDKKAALAFELDDENTVVQCSTDKYDEYQDLFGWRLLKELPTRNLSEKFDDLSDDFIEKYEGTTDSSNNRNQQTLDPTTRRIELTGCSGQKKRAGTVKEELEDGGIYCHGKTKENLVIYDTNNETANPALTNDNTLVAEVPRYVYQYLIDCDNVYTEDEMKEKHNSYMVDGKEISEYSDDHAFVFLSEKLREWVDDYDTLTEYMQCDVEEVTVLERGEENNFTFADIDAHLVRSKSVSLNVYAKKLTEWDARIVLEEELPDVDLSSPEAKRMFGRYPKQIDETFLNVVETVKAAGGIQQA